ncbi:hypothetical protein BS50DRAFT_578268 [Corynespora cassiicola Philippines]|uniref:Heterokaryon incompatibility domain-containing protein n=1 Tax=Corynespora cassiicola Philippines TaxID=1448308 RepID=A0A2T2N8S3_CORCC|nr:hypothetical protein BS50DRAFT_578268 [Corynespora cassiicola Philippines]
MANYILRQVQYSDPYNWQFSIKYDASPKWLDLAHNHEIEAEKIVERDTELLDSTWLFVRLESLSHLLYIVTAQGTLDFIDNFRITRGKICTDPRDRIYALYGLATSDPDHRKDYISVRPDYSKSVAQVFSGITRLFFLQDLDALYRYWPLRSYEGPQFHNTPSWIPDLCFNDSVWATEMDEDTDSIFLGLSVAYFNLHRIRINTPLVRFSDDGMILHAAGIYCGEIRRTIPFSSGKEPLHTFMTSNSELDISVQELFEFFWKVHFGEDYPTSGMESDIGSEKNLDGLWSFMPLDSFTNVVLFTTSTKYWGISSKSLRKNDTVAGLFGYDVPFVLRSRPQGGFWMITTAYMRSNEAVKSLPELVDGHESLPGFAKYGLEEFEIH